MKQIAKIFQLEVYAIFGKEMLTIRDRMKQMAIWNGLGGIVSTKIWLI